MRTNKLTSTKCWCYCTIGNNINKGYEIHKTLCSMIFDCKSIQKSLEIVAAELKTVTNRQ